MTYGAFGNMSYEASLEAYDSYLSRMDEINEACEPIEEEIDACKERISRFEIELDADDLTNEERAEIESMIESIREEIEDLKHEMKELVECYR